MNCPKCNQEMTKNGSFTYCHDCQFVVGSDEHKIIKITELLNSWISKQGHDSCWYYPDIFAALCAELGIEWKQPALPPQKEFEAGCCTFRAELYKDLQEGYWKDGLWFGNEIH